MLRLPGVDHAVSLPALALVGLIVGYVAGMFGVGGGFLLTPALIYVFGIPVPLAIGSGMCQQCGTSLAAFLKYRQLRRGEPRIDLIMVGGSLMGVEAGTHLLTYLKDLGNWRVGSGPPVPVVQVVLDFCFLALLVFVASYTARDVWMARKRVKPRGDVTLPGWLVTGVRLPPYVDLPNVQLASVSVPMLAYLGLLLGFMSGLMGLGGGVLFLPVMLYGLGLSVRNAAGTGVLLLFVTVAVGTMAQAWRGNVSLPLALAILIGSSIGSQLGALTTHYLPNRTLRLFFVGFVLIAVGMIAWDMVKVFR